MMGIKAGHRDSLGQKTGKTCCQGDVLLKNWLNCVSKMAFLNRVDEFHFGDEVMQILAYAYHVKLCPTEAVAFLRQVTNKMGDDDPGEVREIEARAKDLMLITGPDEDQNFEFVRQHVSRFIKIPTSGEQRPEPTRTISLGKVSEELRQAC